MQGVLGSDSERRLRKQTVPRRCSADNSGYRSPPVPSSGSRGAPDSSDPPGSPDIAGARWVSPLPAAADVRGGRLASRAEEDRGPPRLVARGERDLGRDGEGDGEEHPDRAEHPPPEDEGEEDDEGGEAHPPPHEPRLEDAPEEDVDREVARRRPGRRPRDRAAPGRGAPPAPPR